jgi:CRISPR-associated protein Cmr5
MQTRDQQLAAQIFEKVCKVAEFSDSDRKKYGSMAHKLPVLIRTAGLVQALAFVDARGEKAQHTLLDHVAQVIGFNERRELLDKSRTAALNEYMHLSQQVMNALLWYKRFAQSVLGVEQGAEAEGEGVEEESADDSVSS